MKRKYFIFTRWLALSLNLITSTDLLDAAGPVMVRKYEGTGTMTQTATTHYGNRGSATCTRATGIEAVLYSDGSATVTLHYDPFFHFSLGNPSPASGIPPTLGNVECANIDLSTADPHYGTYSRREFTVSARGENISGSFTDEILSGSLEFTGTHSMTIALDGSTGDYTVTKTLAFELPITFSKPFPLTVSRLTPPDATVNVALQGEYPTIKLIVSAEFEAPIDPSSVDASAFVVRDPITFKEYSGTTDINENQVTWTSTSLDGLLDGVELDAVIRGGEFGIEGFLSQHLDEDLVWSFTTMPELAIAVDPVQALEGMDWVWGKPGVIRVKAIWDEVGSAAREFTSEVVVIYDKGTSHEIREVNPNAVFFNSLHIPNTKEGDRFQRREHSYVTKAPAIYLGSYGEHTVDVEIIPKPSGDTLRIYTTDSSEKVRVCPPSGFLTLDFARGIFYAPIPVGGWSWGNQRNIGGVAQGGDAILRKLFPVPDSSYIAGISSSVIGITPPLTGWFGGQGAAEEYLIRALDRYRLNLNPRPYAIVGVTPADYLSNPGLSQGGSSFKSALVRDGSEGNIVAHEIAHVIAFPKGPNEHTPTPYDFTGYEIDRDFYVARHSLNMTQCLLDENVALLPDTSTWITPWAYQRLRDRFVNCGGTLLTLASSESRRTLRSLTQGNSTQTVVVSGEIVRFTGQETAALDSVLIVNGLPESVEVALGEYSVALLGDAGVALQSVLFAPEWRTIEDGRDYGSFLFQFPFDSRLRAVVLKRSDFVLASLSSSEHAPEITWIQEPQGSVTGVTSIRWDATDLDGEELAYSLLYSPDNGDSWRPIGIDFKENEIPLDTTGLPNGNQCLLKIVASDGFHSASILSTAFSVANPPRILSQPETSNAGMVSVAGDLRVYFRDPMDSTTLNQNTVTLEWGGQPVPATVAYEERGNVVILKPDGYLEHGRTYTLALDEAVKDATGQSLPNRTEWTLNTEPAPEIQATDSSPGETPSNAVAPQITAQPQNQTVTAGGDAEFKVVASGAEPLNYQWKRNGFALVNRGSIAGAESSTLQVSSVSATDAGSYTVVVSTTEGLSVTSMAAVLEVLPVGQSTISDTGIPDGFINFLPTEHDLYDIAYAHGTYVAVGHDGVILTSTDRLDWSEQIVEDPFVHFNAVDTDGSVLIAVGVGVFSRGAAAYRSTDGVSWSSLELPGDLSSSFQSIRFLQGRFFATANREVWSSSDGLNWRQEYAPESGFFLYGITYGQGKYVAAGDGSSIALAPESLSSWNSQRVTQSGMLSFGDVFYTEGYGGLFVAVGNVPGVTTPGSGKIITSSNGDTWVEAWSEDGSSINGVAEGKGLLVAVGTDGKIYHSQNGQQWEPGTVNTPVYLRKVRFVQDEAVFLAVGNKGAVFSSNNGTNWRQLTSFGAAGIGQLSSLNAVTFSTDKNLFAAVGQHGMVLTSPDGLEWTRRSSGTEENLWDAIFSPEHGFVVVGENGVVVDSDDGVSWKNRTAQAGVWLVDVAAGPNGLVATGNVGQDGRILRTSALGSNWTEVNSVSGKRLNGVTYAGGTYVAVGGRWTESLVLTSADGVSWAEQDVSTHGIQLADVEFLRNRFVAPGDGGVLISEDGRAWNKFSPGSPYPLEAISSNDAVFLLTSGQSWLMTSPEGENWTRLELPIKTYTLGGTAYGNGTFVVVGSNGLILSSQSQSAPAIVDSDADGLSDEREGMIGTDSRNPDTDNDGLTDGQEVNQFGTDPKLADSDGDGVNDGAEVIAGTDPGVAPSGCVAAPSGLVGWWTGDGTIADAAGDHPGTLKNGAGYASGNVGEGFVFDGVDDFVEVADSDLWAFGANDFTIELWVRFNSVRPGSSIGLPAAVFVGNDAGAGGSPKWFFSYGGGFLTFLNGRDFMAEAAFAPVPRQWYHLAVRRTGSTYSIFADGKQVSSEEDGFIIPNPQAPLTIGQAEGIGFFDGQLDEISIYNRALSDAELRAIQQAGSNGKCKAPSGGSGSGGGAGGLIHQYTFNEGGGTIVEDRIGNADAEIKGEGYAWGSGMLTLPGGASTSAAYVDLPDGIISSLTDATFEAWLTVDQHRVWARIFDFGSTSVPGGELDGPGGDGAGVDYILLSASIGGDGDSQRVEIRDGDSGRGDIANPQGQTTLGEEFHVAVVYDSKAGEIRYYRNGSQLSVLKTEIRLREINDVNNWVGRSNWTADENLQGALNEFRIYDRVLSEEEVRDSYAAGTDAVGPGGGIGPPQISIAIDANGNIVLTFEGTLHSADAVTGPFAEVPGAVSPLIFAPSSASQFYRSVRP